MSTVSRKQAAPPIAAIPFESFPHILDSICSYATYGTLTVLARTSKLCYERAVRRIYAHIILLHIEGESETTIVLIGKEGRFLKHVPDSLWKKHVRLLDIVLHARAKVVESPILTEGGFALDCIRIWSSSKNLWDQTVHDLPETRLLILFGAPNLQDGFRCRTLIATVLPSDPLGWFVGYLNRRLASDDAHEMKHLSLVFSEWDWAPRTRPPSESPQPQFPDAIRSLAQLAESTGFTLEVNGLERIHKNEHDMNTLSADPVADFYKRFLDDNASWVNTVAFNVAGKHCDQITDLDLDLARPTKKFVDFCKAIGRGSAW